MRFSDLYSVQVFAMRVGLPHPAALTDRLWALTNAIVEWDAPSEEERRELRERTLGSGARVRMLVPRHSSVREQYATALASRALARVAWQTRTSAIAADVSRPIAHRRLAFVLGCLLVGWFDRERRARVPTREFEAHRVMALDPAFSRVADYFAYAMTQAGDAAAPGPAALGGFELAVKATGFTLLDTRLPPGIARVVALFDASPVGSYMTSGKIEAAYRGDTEARSKASTIGSMMRRYGFTLDSAKSNPNAPRGAKGYRLMRAN